MTGDRKGRADAIAEIRQRMVEYRLTVRDIEGASKPRGTNAQRTGDPRAAAHHRQGA